MEQSMEKAILVVNCGSSSLKYEVYQMPSGQSLGKGVVERIGLDDGHLTQKSPRGVIDITTPIPDHSKAMELLKSALTDGSKGLVSSLETITGVGHRVVHGGEHYSESVVIDDEVLGAIEASIELAPLHNPANLTGIIEATKILPGRPQVAVFDTAFHQTIPPSAYLYALPRQMYDQYKIRRYGFHGTSHRYVAKEALTVMKRAEENTNLISCHLGNGASITAISGGQSMDTSMGFTPLEGLMMGTRSGDVDPAVILYLLERGYSAEELNSILNKKSGLLGLSGISNDLRDVEAAAADGNKVAQEALDVYAHRVRRYIGGYAANMVKLDGMIFTAGVGEHGYRMRDRICRRLENLGIFMDYEKNAENGPNKGIISKDYSPVTILVIPTNEELQIAKDTYQLAFEA